MSSSLNQKDQDKVRAAHAAFFESPKRKHSTAEYSTHNSTTAPPNGMKRFKFPGMTSAKPSETPDLAPLIVRFYDADIKAQDAHGRTQEDILLWSWEKLESSHNYIQMLFPVPEGSAFNWEAPVIDRKVMDAFRSRQDLQDRLRLSFERMLDFYGFEIKTQPEENKKTEEKPEAENSPKDVAKSTVEGPTSADLTETTTTESEDTKKHEVAVTPGNATTTNEDTSKPKPTPNASTAQPGYHIVRAPHWRTSFRNWAVRFDHNHLRITRILRCLRILGLQTECKEFFKVLKDVFDDPSVNISERTMMYWTRAVTRPLYIAPDDDRIEWLKEWEEEQEKEKEDADKGGKEEL